VTVVLTTSRPSDTDPGRHPDGLDLQQAERTARSDRAAITAARQQLGRQLAALRAGADLTQAALGLRIGYRRSTVGGAEAGDSASRDFYAAADRALDAKGMLVARHDEIEIMMRIARSEAARRARAAARAQAAAIGGPPERDRAATVLDGICPCCQAPLTVTVQVAADLIAQFALTGPGKLAR
jgi:transcriptional regulator with XRE-family HTH domain